jgi:hypothetical protein
MVLLQPNVCSATPSTKFRFGTSMHLLFQSLMSRILEIGGGVWLPVGLLKAMLADRCRW